MAVNIFRSLVVDRIRFFVYVSAKDLYSHVWSQLYEIAAMKKELLPNGIISVSKDQHCKTRLRYCPQARRCIASIEIGVAPDNKKYFSLDLYPTRFRGGEFANFKELLKIFLEDFNYAKLFYTAKISYLELAADSLSRAMGDFLAFRAKTGSSKVHLLPDDTGGVYLGALGGRLHFCIYDKRRQIVEKLKEVPPHKTHTRLEARIHSTGLAAIDLLEGLQNPFPKLEIADLAVLKETYCEPEFHAFLSLCIQSGACAALHSLSVKQRRIYLARIRKAKVNWWRPAAIWGQFSNALAVLNP